MSITDEWFIARPLGAGVEWVVGQTVGKFWTNVKYLSKICQSFANIQYLSKF